ncbi:14182_t:CDS:2 [Rhizophagus irregularis]|nr:14182_t:CDS:2 [Rhizophagus irregularis]
MDHTVKVEEIPHNGKPITKIAISPQSKYIMTYSQEDKSFVGWCSKTIKTTNLDILDYKVSDDKILMYESNDELAIIYDMKNKKKITLNSSVKKYADDKYEFNIPYYKFTNFLTSGDLITYNIIESKGFKSQTIRREPVILIYSSNTKGNIWKCKSTYELDDTMEINFGGITNDMGNVDTKMIELKYLKPLMVISIEGIHYIYSDRMDFIIKIIVGTNLENSTKYNTMIKSFLETNGNSNYFNYFNNIQFRLNDRKVFGIFYEKPWMINIKKCDLENYIINNNYIDSEEINKSKDSINGNIFYNIGKQFTAAKDETEFIEKYVIPNLVNSNENQSGYDMRLRKNEFILEAFINNSSQNEIVSSYNIKYSKSWKDIKVNNTYILYDETELHIYIFNTAFYKIEMQCCYNIKFLKYAFRLYNNNKPDALKIEEIKEIAQPTDNNGLKKQWILVN